ncbi:MAG: hypothetical protein ABIH66_00855, partial [bacterium]
NPIAILLYEGVPEELVEPLLPELEDEFGLPFYIIEGARGLPERFFDEERGQYRAGLVVRDVADAKPKSAVRIVGIMGEDIYAGRWSFLFGISSPKNAAALLSIRRLRTDDKKKFSRRVLTEIVHELGHTFGLQHCNSTHCAMRFSLYVGHVDGKGAGLCRACRRKLKKAIEALEKEKDF